MVCALVQTERNRFGENSFTQIEKEEKYTNKKKKNNYIVAPKKNYINEYIHWLRIFGCVTVFWFFNECKSKNKTKKIKFERFFNTFFHTMLTNLMNISMKNNNNDFSNPSSVLVRFLFLPLPTAFLFSITLS